MGAAVLFSGGLDSTVLAFDIVGQPSRYGLNPEEDLRVNLLTLAFSEEEAQEKEKNLGRLVSFLQDLNDEVEVLFDVLILPGCMGSYEKEIPRNLQSTTLCTPLPRKFSKSSEQRKGMSSAFTPQMHLAGVAMAANQLEIPRLPHHSGPIILAGFQYEPEAWDLHDEGNLSSSDTSPEWVAQVNKVLAVSTDGKPVRLVAPFLDARMSKFDILSLAYDLGIPVDDTSSCVEGWMKNCGHCVQCVLRSRTVAAYQSRILELAKKGKKDNNE